MKRTQAAWIYKATGKLLVKVNGNRIVLIWTPTKQHTNNPYLNVMIKLGLKTLDSRIEGVPRSTTLNTQTTPYWNVMSWPLGPKRLGDKGAIGSYHVILRALTTRCELSHKHLCKSVTGMIFAQAKPRTWLFTSSLAVEAAPSASVLYSFTASSRHLSTSVMRAVFSKAFVAETTSVFCSRLASLQRSVYCLRA